MQRAPERGKRREDMEPTRLGDEPASALESLVESVEMLASHVLEGPDGRHPRARDLVDAFRDGLLRGEPPVARLAPRPLIPQSPPPTPSKQVETDDAEAQDSEDEDAESKDPEEEDSESKDSESKGSESKDAPTEEVESPPKFVSRQYPPRRKKPDPRSALVAAARSEPFLALELLRQASRPGRVGRSLDLRLAARSIPLAHLRKLVAGAGNVASVGPWDPLLENVRRHAMLSARTAELVARGRMRRDSGALYTMALVHNIGELAIIDLYRNLGQAPPTDGIARGALAKEMRRFHAPVGALMLRRWQLPLVVVAVAEHHNDPLSLPQSGSVARYSALVAAATAAVTQAGVHYREEHEDVDAALRIGEAVLGIRAKIFEAAAKTALEEWSRMCPGDAADP